MSHEYAMSRVQDALTSCNGNANQAQRLLMGWLEKDQTLLLGLVGPHIKSIVTHAISHAVNKDKEPKRKIDLETEEIGDFGQALLENVLGRSARAPSSSGPSLNPPPPSSGAAGRPTKASHAHVSAMQALASKSSTQPSGDTSGKKKK